MCIFRTINGLWEDLYRCRPIRDMSGDTIDIVPTILAYTPRPFTRGRRNEERIRKIRHTFGIVSKLGGREERKVQKRDKFCTSG